MKHSSDVSFDKLDKKLIKELPLVAEVLTATMAKLSRQFEPYYDDIQGILRKEIAKHRHWSIRETERNVFYPFISENTNRKGITRLENEFWLFNYIECHKKIRGKLVNTFGVQFGYLYQRDDKKKPVSYFFFDFIKWRSSARHGGQLLSSDFYEDLQQRMNDYECVVLTPAEDESEGIELRCRDLDAATINRAYNGFKSIALPSILKKIRFG